MDDWNMFVQYLLNDLSEYVKKIYDNDPQKQFESASFIRKLLSVENNPPIDDVMKTGVVPRLIAMLDYNGKEEQIYEKIKFELTWILLNISSGTHEQVNILILHDIIPKFITLLSMKE